LSKYDDPWLLSSQIAVVNDNSLSAGFRPSKVYCVGDLIFLELFFCSSLKIPGNNYYYYYYYYPFDFSGEINGER